MQNFLTHQVVPPNDSINFLTNLFTSSCFTRMNLYVHMSVCVKFCFQMNYTLAHKTPFNCSRFPR